MKLTVGREREGKMIACIIKSSENAYTEKNKSFKCYMVLKLNSNISLKMCILKYIY